MKKATSIKISRALHCSFGALVVLGLFTSSGCKLRQGMWNQPKIEPYEESDFYADKLSARHPVDGTVARGHLNDDPHLFSGMVDGEFAETFPMPVDRALLERGQSRFNIYCTPCHDAGGSGNGMVVQRGYKQPTSFHDERLRNEKPGYFYHVIKNGFGVMPSYSYQVKAEDRWAIAAYIRVLQLSRQAGLEDIPETERANLAAGHP